MNFDDDILKRIIKGYLYHNGEATIKMILNHINTVNYGLVKQYTTKSLAKKLRYWRNQKKTWFRINFYKTDNGVILFYLEDLE